MKRRRPPRRLDASRDEVRAIVAKTTEGPLSQQEQEILSAVAETLFWLEDGIESRSISIKRLRRMIFGHSTEKTDAIFPESSDESDGEGSETPAGNDEAAARLGGGAGREDDAAPKAKGHGRNPAAAYEGADKVCVNHEDLKPGDVCPGCKKGKVRRLPDPAVLVRITGGAPVRGTVFEMERLRCDLCGKVFTARGPPKAGPRKYDESAAATIALLHYGLGTPFNRLARLQKSMRIPLPASTQWEVVRDAAQSVMPVYEELILQAAQGEVVHNDDTTMTVLSLTGKRRAKEAPADDPPDRTGMYTTGVVSVCEGRRIALFFTGRQHAGENLRDVLERRAAQLSAPIQMCDGLSHNTPPELETILANCLIHARRYYVDVADNFPTECRYVLETLRDVFRNDATARKVGMSADERLTFHQEHSKPLMDGLEAWMKEQFEQRLVEPNSGLGEAIKYMQRHWEALTLFLRVPGAPLQNNVVERALKRAIVHRKNSLFYRTLNGARVGDAFMSIIHTAELHDVDPYEYLVALLRHPDEVRDAPGDWMPWNYEETLAARRLGEAA